MADRNGTGAAPVIVEELVHTGQHYDHNMSGCFFEEMGIPQPAVNLGIGSGRHGETTGAMLAGIERELLSRRPDLVLVYGDTNSTLAGALAAAKLHIPVAHVEAGLRSFNRRMPEEINRVVTDHVSSLLFCPSEASRKQLAMEGITEGVHVVGDVMYDAVLRHRTSAQRPGRVGFALATIHRAENTDVPERLRDVALILEACPVPVLLLAHPRTRKALESAGVRPQPPIEVLDAVPYFALLGYLDACSFVITDSGGLQKEAYFFGKKCVTLRSETEWTELVEIGANRLLRSSSDSVAAAFAWAQTPLAGNARPYGDGRAGAKIVECIAAWGGTTHQRQG
jgi:UDP-GlcNAc3NAcA epimerase